MDLEALKFPIGKYQFSGEVSDEIFSKWIKTIEELPEKLKKIISSLSYDELELQ